LAILYYANFFQWWNTLPDNLKDNFVKEQSNENNQIPDKHLKSIKF